MAIGSGSLPAPCDACKGNDWILTERRGVSAMGRCGCVRGQMLTARAIRPTPPERAEPVLTADEISLAVEGLSGMPWFPHEEGARTMIADAIARLCSNSQACFELVRLMVDRYQNWPGVREMRICYCAVIGLPLSGEDLHLAVSEFYPDGFGPVVPKGPATLALPPGHVVSADRQLDDSIQALAVAKDIDPETRRRAALLRPWRAAAEVPTNPDFKPVTQADIDKAVDELREKRARAELTDLYGKFL